VRVGDHVIHGAIDEAYGALLDDPPDPVVAHVNVLCAGMVLVVACECNGGLVVREKSCRILERSEDSRQ
jgi:hypothetical protein